jgi:hypothetical protein
MLRMEPGGLWAAFADDGADDGAGELAGPVAAGPVGRSSVVLRAGGGGYDERGLCELGGAMGGLESGRNDSGGRSFNAPCWRASGGGGKELRRRGGGGGRTDDGDRADRGRRACSRWSASAAAMIRSASSALRVEASTWVFASAAV